MHFDTGSNVLWIPTEKVSGVTPIFNTSRSSTFVNTSSKGSVSYVDGSGVSGTFGTDMLQIQGSAVNITAGYLWVTEEIDMVYPDPIQGLVGMGFTSIKNFLDVAYEKGDIKSNVFALEIKDEREKSYIHYN